MKAVARCPQFHVYDDVLPEEQFRAVWTFLQLETLVTVHHDGWQKSWRLMDGFPLRSPSAVVYRPGAAPEAAAAEGARPARAFPTHSGVDRVLEAVAALSEDVAPVVGVAGRDYDRISACAFVYPQGTGLSWHTDTPRLYTGAYVFFAHPEWKSQWGGELLVGEEEESPAAGPRTIVTLRRGEAGELKPARVDVPPFLDEAFEAEPPGSLGLGRFIAPRPNRLVVIAGGRPHMVNRVSPAAGDHARCSVSGFLLRPGR